MSNSYKKTPISGVTHKDSEKKDKRFANRKFRRLTKTLLVNIDNETKLPVSMNQVSDPWSMDKDGKSWFGGFEDKEWYRQVIGK